TREHLAICSLLHIRTGLVVLTKTDTVESDWIELVRDDVATLVRGTFLEGAPVVPVSAKTGAGLDELRATLRRLAATVPARGHDAGGRRPRDPPRRPAPAQEPRPRPPARGDERDHGAGPAARGRRAGPRQAGLRAAAPGGAARRAGRRSLRDPLVLADRHHRRRDAARHGPAKAQAPGAARSPERARVGRAGGGGRGARARRRRRRHPPARSR